MKVLFPSAIMYGMSSKEFWEDDPQLYWAYRTFYFKNLELEEQKRDYNCWLSGYYNYYALTTALSNMFRKKGTKPNEYMDKPMLQKLQEKQDAKREINDKNIYQQQQFNAWARY